MGDEYEQLYEGDWTAPVKSGFKERCCDCGLVHILDFRVVDGQVQFRFRLAPRATAQVRRHMKGPCKACQGRGQR